MRERWVRVWALAGAALLGCSDGSSPRGRADAAVSPEDVVADSGEPDEVADAAADGDEPAEVADAAADAANAAESSWEGGTRSAYADFAGTLPVEAIFLGVCGGLSRATDATKCKGIDALLACSRETCGFDACAEICKDHLQCLAASNDRCPANTACPYGDPCLACAFPLAACTWMDKCKGLYSCATPTPGGPCSKVETCCKSQRDPTLCLGWLETETTFGGDEACTKLMTNTGFAKAYANDPPCTFQ
jgi:hypothetical protein